MFRSRLAILGLGRGHPTLTLDTNHPTFTLSAKNSTGPASIFEDLSEVNVTPPGVTTQLIPNQRLEAGNITMQLANLTGTINTKKIYKMGTQVSMLACFPIERNFKVLAKKDLGEIILLFDLQGV